MGGAGAGCFLRHFEQLTGKGSPAFWGRATCPEGCAQRAVPSGPGLLCSARDGKHQEKGWPPPQGWALPGTLGSDPAAAEPPENCWGFAASFGSHLALSALHGRFRAEGLARPTDRRSQRCTWPLIARLPLLL